MSTLPTRVKGTVIVHHTDPYIPEGGEPGEPIASLAPQPPHTLYNQRSYRLQQSGVTRNGEQLKVGSYTITGTYSATYHFSNGTTVSDSGTVSAERTGD